MLTFCGKGRVFSFTSSVCKKKIKCLVHKQRLFYVPFRESAHFHVPLHTEFVFHDIGVFVGTIGEDSDSDFFQTCLIRGCFSEERRYAHLNKVDSDFSYFGLCKPFCYTN